MPENLRLSFARYRLHGRRRLPYPMPSRPGVRFKVDFRRFPPSDEEASSTVTDLKWFQRIRLNGEGAV